MRTDCTRDNQKTFLPKATSIGYATRFAKRGCWVRYQQEGASGSLGRVVGRVHADNKTYLEIVALLGAADIPAIRWIAPADVLECYADPPRHIFEFICGDWRSPEAIIARLDQGFSRSAQEVLPGRSKARSTQQAAPGSD